jgi:hypothetical protein
MSIQPGQLYIDILDPARQALLPLLKPLKSQFYLAGGTALALQKGHRDSVDFDFFTPDAFDAVHLQQELNVLLKDYEIVVTQTELNTLSLLVNESIQLSFFSYQYPLVEPLVETPNIRLASIIDIGCMKLSAILSRSTLKDYVDLFVILHDITLKDLLKAASKKFPTIDSNVFLKALVYFEDIEDEPVIFQPGHFLDRTTLEKFLRETVREALLST